MKLLKIVANVKRALALGAHGLRAFSRRESLAARAFQILNRWHLRNDNRWPKRPATFAG
jgi:hypothetical protein